MNLIVLDYKMMSTIQMKTKNINRQILDECHENLTSGQLVAVFPFETRFSCPTALRGGEKRRETFKQRKDWRNVPKTKKGGHSKYEHKKGSL